MTARNGYLTADEIRPAMESLHGFKRMAGYYVACCPAHEDRNQSLVLYDSGAFSCKRNCDTGLVLKEMGLSRRVRPQHIVKTYPYTDENGATVHETVRRGPVKKFEQRQPVGNGDYQWNLQGGIEIVPYRLPELLAAPLDEWVLFPEGEQDADNCAEMGLTATCNPGGAGGGRWLPGFGKYLAGRKVAVLADKDAGGTGRTHAQKVAASARASGAVFVKVIELPGEGKDVSDWRAAGGSREELLRIIEEAPEWTPPPVTKIPDEGLVSLADIEPKRLQWLWRGWLPVGKLVVLDGDPGLGKSQILLDIAARLSRGDVMPDESEPGISGPVSTLLLSAEDDLADTIVPRLMAAGADLGRIHARTLVNDSGEMRYPTIADIDRLRSDLLITGARLVVIDPLMAYLPETTNAHRDQQMRRLLAPLADLAGEFGAVVAALRHLNKSAATSAMYRGGGSIGIIGAARLGILVGKDPNDSTGKRRVIAAHKQNLADDGATLAYHVESVGDVSRIVWDGASSVCAQDMLGEDGDGLALRDAMEFLRVELAGGPVGSEVIYGMGEQAGHSKRTLQRAKGRLGVESVKDTGSMRGKWCWALPDPTPPPPDPPAPEPPVDDAPRPDWESPSPNSGDLGDVGDLQEQGTTTVGPLAPEDRQANPEDRQETTKIAKGFVVKAVATETVSEDRQGTYPPNRAEREDRQELGGTPPLPDPPDPAVPEPPPIDPPPPTSAPGTDEARPDLPERCEDCGIPIPTDHHHCWDCAAKTLAAFRAGQAVAS